MFSLYNAIESDTCLTNKYKHFQIQVMNNIFPLISIKHQGLSIILEFNCKGVLTHNLSSAGQGFIYTPMVFVSVLKLPTFAKATIRTNLSQTTTMCSIMFPKES